MNLLKINIFLYSLFCISICNAQDTYIEKNWKMLANEMVEYQIEDRGVKDKNVIQVMKNTPRHLFVPQEFIYESYNDRPIPIGEDQTISQPYIVALMTELLQLEHSDNVLEIGTGSGYQLAVLSQLIDFCYSIEIKESLATNARKKLNSLGYNNVKIKFGDGYQGWKEYAPFDKIIITAAPTEIPPELIKQLKEGGLMVLPVGESHNQELIVVRKKGQKLIKEYIIPVRFVPMIHKDE
jgi:protein-L-isoaspartate(D-aspartate) O-methyltransferase